MMNDTSIPDYTHLMEMANTEWKNRVERRGIHYRVDWCSGWMAGFLYMDKPDWSKEHDAAIRKDEREKVLDEIHEKQKVEFPLARIEIDKFFKSLRTRSRTPA